MTADIERPEVVTAIARAAALGLILGHQPRSEDNYGRTCDEQGCAYCNAGLDLWDELASDIVDRPDRYDIGEALADLAACIPGSST